MVKATRPARSQRDMDRYMSQYRNALLNNNFLYMRRGMDKATKPRSGSRPNNPTRSTRRSRER